MILRDYAGDADTMLRHGESKLRIGVMLRSYDEKGGVGVYTRNVIEELLRIDQRNHYVLLWRNPENVGRFAHLGNVTERLLRAKNTAIWDQVMVPYACWRERVDVLFHPKFTVPLASPCKSVMVLHGVGWFVKDSSQFFNRWDLRYIRLAMPAYLRRSAVAIAVSQITTDTFTQRYGLPPGKVQTVYFAPGRQFARVTDQGTLREARARYGLPERFILTLTKPGGDRRKNFGGVLEAYSRYHQGATSPHKLVVGGKDCHYLRDEYRIPSEGYGQDVLFTGWIDQKDLPAVLSLADLYLYPSNLEAFPIPLTEAMACGTPIVTSNANGLREIAGDAALFVDPSDAGGTAAAIRDVLTNPELKSALSARGLARSKQFTWEACAQRTLSIIESASLRKSTSGAA